MSLLAETDTSEFTIQGVEELRETRVEKSFSKEFNKERLQEKRKR